MEKTLDQLKEEFLKTNKIKYIGKKKKEPFETNEILTIYKYDVTERVL